MTRPVVDAVTERVYRRLPEVYRTHDERHGDWPLLRYLSTLTDQWGRWVELVDDPTLLADPARARAEWLPWLAQLVGVKLQPRLTEQERRSAIAAPATGWLAGTKEGIRLAAAERLSGAQHVEVHDHAVTEPGDGTVWDVLIRTRRSETGGWDTLTAAAPTWADVEALGNWNGVQDNTLPAFHTILTDLGLKPAGVVIHHGYADRAWHDVHLEATTWADWHAAPGTWADLYEPSA